MSAKKTVKKIAKKSVKKGNKYACQACGLVVKVDRACGCAQVCDIICCGKKLKPVKK